MKVLAIDQGTTATKSFTLDESGRFESVAAFEHKQIYPNAGWVEHDAEELLRNIRSSLEAASQVDAMRAAEVIAAMAELTPLGKMISVDGGLTKNAYFNRFLANALQKTLIVQESPELTGLGTARMAMRGAGESVLPPLPAPRAKITPDAPLSQDLLQRFSEAIERAKNWK